MRFDPKLLTPDDAPLRTDGEIDLPDDLLELAAQLTDDARYLAQRFPAPEPSGAATVSPAATVALQPASRKRSWRWAAASAAGLLVVASVVVPQLVPSSHTAPKQNAASVPYQPVAAEDSRALARERLLAAEAALAMDDWQQPPLVGVTGPVRPAPRSQPRIIRLPDAPALLEAGVSDPELEGLLDLWQNEGPAEVRISM